MASSLCTVCYEHQHILHTTQVDNASVCHDCLHYLFQRAVDDEANYPPTWASLTLHPDQFSMLGIFTPELLKDYANKEREYNCPPALRIYCSWPEHNTASNGKAEATDAKCDTFLGRKMTTATEFMSNRASSVVTCRKCTKPSCIACGKCIEVDPRSHKCLDLQAADAEAEAFVGLTRGRDYQICPSERCGRRVELSDGCNHIQCFCKMQFCFICGEPALEGNRHWSRRADGSLPACPRYNQPGAQRAMYDGPNPRPQAVVDALMAEALPLGHRRRGAVVRGAPPTRGGQRADRIDLVSDPDDSDEAALERAHTAVRRGSGWPRQALEQNALGRADRTALAPNDIDLRTRARGDVPPQVWVRPMRAAQNESVGVNQHPDPLRSHPAPLDQAALDHQAAQNVEAFEELPRYYMQGGRGLFASDTPQSPRDHVQPGGPIRNFGTRTSFARDRTSSILGNALGVMGDQNASLLTPGHGLSRQRSAPRFHPYEMPPDRMQYPEERLRDNEPNNVLFGQLHAGAEARYRNSRPFDGTTMTGLPPIDPRAEFQHQQTARERRRSALEDMWAAHLDADEPMRNRYPHGRESGTNNGAFTPPRNAPSLFSQDPGSRSPRAAGRGRQTQTRRDRQVPPRGGMLGIGNGNLTPRSNYPRRSDRTDVSQAGAVPEADTDSRRRGVRPFGQEVFQTSPPAPADFGSVRRRISSYPWLPQSPAPSPPQSTGMPGIGDSGAFMHLGPAGQAQLAPPTQASMMWSAMATASHEDGQNRGERQRMRDRRPPHTRNSHRAEPNAHHPDYRATVGTDSDAPNERTRRILHPPPATSAERAVARDQTGRPVRLSAFEVRPTPAAQRTTRATNRPRPSTGPARFSPVTGTHSPINERNNADADISPGSFALGRRNSDARELFSTRTGHEFHQHDEPDDEPGDEPE